MRTLLVFPPASDPCHPPLGISMLAGFFRQRGKEVYLRDLNVLSYYAFLTQANIVRCADKLRDRLKELESKGTLSPDNYEEYRLVAENSLAAEYLAGEVEKALSDLRNPATYKGRYRYAHTSSIIRRCMEFISAAHYPLRWYLRGFSMSHLPTKAADVLAATQDREQNLFIPFFESQVADIVDLQPGIIGISINYYCQMIPGMTLASILKKHLPETFIVAGGSLISFFEERWEVLAPFRSLVDGWIPFEGEQPLFDLIQTLKSSDARSGAPGLLYFEDNIARYNVPGSPPDLEELPAPSFDGLPLEKYLAPELVLPVLGCRGCYWGRCVFCSHDQLYRNHVRFRSGDGVLRELHYLAERYHARYFYFTDEAITPKMARHVANEVIRSNLPYRWFGEIRFEQTLDSSTLQQLKAGGCRMLIFGLESGVQRVLDLMDKGITPARVSRILKDCYNAGIRTFVMFFIGFPTESLREAEVTIRFVENLQREITYIAYTSFILEQHSPVYREPVRFGVSEIEKSTDEELRIFSEYTVEDGMSADQVIAFLKEVRKRPVIKSLLDPHLISRSHLIFLPAFEVIAPKDAALLAPDISRAETVFPIRCGDLVPGTFLFDLDSISRLLKRETEHAVIEPLEQCPTHYVLNSEREKLLDVGEDGLSLLKTCNGHHSLAEILDVAGQINHKTILNFFADLHQAGFIRWESRA